MERIIIALCFVVSTQSVNTWKVIGENVDSIHHLVKRQDGGDMIKFTPECTATFTSIDEKCMTNILTLIDTYKTVESEVVQSWAEQCGNNMYDCLASPDAETKEVIKYFKVLLPKITALCADGCMIPIINLIHACLSEDAIARLGLTRSEMEDIFDLVCIQQDAANEGQEDYCIIKAMTTASYLYEANQINYCNLDSIDLDTCGLSDSNPCICPTNCSNLITQASGLMGCCMGTILQLESKFRLSHPDNDDLLNPGNQLFKLCGVETQDACLTSKDVLAAQNATYQSCAAALDDNSKSKCIALSDDVHGAYLSNMQDINATCVERKNLNLCKESFSKTLISQDLRAVLERLNSHCDDCSAELQGIRDTCTVFLPNEAKMIFQMMCLRNTDMEHCGPKIIEYEAEQERIDLNSNPCFMGFMPTVQNTCSEACASEVTIMNKYNVLNCFDAMIDYTHTPVNEWVLWHKNCIKDPKVEINNQINITLSQMARNTNSGATDTNTLIKTVAYTFVGTVMLSLLITAIVVLIYKRQMVYNMFGYNKFTGDNLITDVHMEDTMGEDGGENLYNDYYD